MEIVIGLILAPILYLPIPLIIRFGFKKYFSYGMATLISFIQFFAIKIVFHIAIGLLFGIESSAKAMASGILWMIVGSCILSYKGKLTQSNQGFITKKSPNRSNYINANNTGFSYSTNTISNISNQQHSSNYNSANMSKNAFQATTQQIKSVTKNSKEDIFVDAILTYKKALDDDVISEQYYEIAKKRLFKQKESNQIIDIGLEIQKVDFLRKYKALFDHQAISQSEYESKIKEIMINEK